MSKRTAPLPDWESVLSSAAHLQEILPGAVLVGGTAAAIHGGGGTGQDWAADRTEDHENEGRIHSGSRLDPLRPPRGDGDRRSGGGCRARCAGRRRRRARARRRALPRQLRRRNAHRPGGAGRAGRGGRRSRRQRAVHQGRGRVRIGRHRVRPRLPRGGGGAHRCRARGGGGEDDPRLEPAYHRIAEQRDGQPRRRAQRPDLPRPVRHGVPPVRATLRRHPRPGVGGGGEEQGERALQPARADGRAPERGRHPRFQGPSPIR